MASSTQSLEQKKLNYSRQLAEHTLRQWNSVREEVDIDRPIRLSSRRKSSTRFISPRSHSSDTGSDEGTPSAKRAVNGIQVVDYGKASPRNGKPADKNQK
eukprot:GHVU01123245.1.p1 GENE.GHVU01123245.1~~GHVU01123245.1.p1  ORF type:complete len:113 (+),score=7.14 GHVU01123245.1:41-340(+)